jgi:CarboxypepD_reg-like domain
MLIVAAQLLIAMQTAPITVTGTVRDANTRAVLAAASVTLVLTGQSGTTDSLGRYQLHAPPGGVQRLIVRCFGHQSYTLDAIIPRTGVLELDITLNPVAQELPTVAVHARRSFVQSTSAPAAPLFDRIVESSALAHHPLTAEPDVVRAFAGGEIAVRGETAGGMTVRGGTSDQVAYSLDGIPVLNPYHIGGLASVWNPDALAQVRLSGKTPSVMLSNALSGALEATTRAAGDALSLRGSISSTQLRLTIDAPITWRDASFLLSTRSVLPTALAPSDPGYLRGDGSEWLAKFNATLLGGMLRVLGVGSENEQTLAQQPPDAALTAPVNARSYFHWGNTSIGLGWDRLVSRATLRVSGWHARSGVESTWASTASETALLSERSDIGAQAAVHLGDDVRNTVIGARVERIGTRYATGTNAAQALLTRVPLIALYGTYSQTLSPTWRVGAGGTLAHGANRVAFDPFVRVHWEPLPSLSLVLAGVRTHQFVQSMRNTESVVSHVLPVDLFIGAGSSGVPVARSTQLSFTANLRASATTHFVASAYQRRLSGLVAVPAITAQPFVVDLIAIPSAVGSADAHGASVEAAVATPRIALIVRYGWNDIRYRANAVQYTPEHSARHQLESGVTFAISQRTELRIGAAAIAGRRATPIIGAVEWEACNLLDRGCEFSGTPTAASSALGSVRLPHYLRTDASVRRRWEFMSRGRRVELAAFGTLTNVLGRANVLNYASDGLSPRALEMRPRAPLVVGIDWRF